MSKHLTFVLLSLLPALPESYAADNSVIAELQGSLLAKVRVTSWHTGCPVPPEDLRVLKIDYVNYHGKEESGELIVHKDVAAEVLSIFKALHKERFPIEQIRPVEEYGGSDDRSMEANNTSAFNCRDVTGQPGKFSNHSWGRAIDINPLTNPYIKGTTVLPPKGRQHLDRTKSETGIIRADRP